MTLPDYERGWLIAPRDRNSDEYLLNDSVRERGFAGTVIVADDLNQQTL